MFTNKKVWFRKETRNDEFNKEQHVWTRVPNKGEHFGEYRWRALRRGGQ